MLGGGGGNGFTAMLVCAYLSDITSMLPLYLNFGACGEDLLSRRCFEYVVLAVSVFKVIG